MFISSYATYIAPTLLPQKTSQESLGKKDEPKSSFSEVFSKNTPKDVEPSKLIQTDSSKARFLVALEQKNKQQYSDEYKKLSTKQSAQKSYKQSLTPFRFSLGLPFTLEQKEPKNDELHELNKNLQKSSMIQTYIANDNYYQVTRARIA